MAGSYNHKCTKAYEAYIIAWVVDRYCKGSKLRFPTYYSRITNLHGAINFCKKWGISFPHRSKVSDE